MTSLGMAQICFFLEFILCEELNLEVTMWFWIVLTIFCVYELKLEVYLSNFDVYVHMFIFYYEIKQSLIINIIRPWN